jgi:hypothetical protein
MIIGKLEDGGALAVEKKNSTKRELRGVGKTANPHLQ